MAVAEIDGSTGERRPIPILDDSPFEPDTAWNRPRNEWRVRALVFFGACVLFLTNLGAFGLWDPWETHYGAVTTNMVETYDWVSPWWGYKEQIGTEAKQGNHFFSKPVYIFWSEAVFSRLVGRGEWALRLPMALLAILAVFMAYIAVSKIWTRKAGLLAALVIGTAPQFFMISRQAQTDMPFVGNMVVALCFFMLALFRPRQNITRRGFWSWMWGTVILIALNTIPQLFIIWTDLPHGNFQVFIWAAGLVLLGVLFPLQLRREIAAEGLSDLLKDRWVRRCCVLIFYVFTAQATYAKGLLGFMLPGAIILVYLILSRTWRVLARVELLRGIGVFALVCFPWYSAMFTVHGRHFWQRFFIHDHFNRLGAGVHQIDSGSFEHFIKWLGVGLYPWAVFAPLALIWAFRQRAADDRPGAQARLFVIAWFLIAFALFTLSSTKFHHYIFPAMPALGILIALFILELLKSREWLARAAVVIAIVMFAGLTWDIHEDPQHVRNLMTYKYDRPMPEHLPIDADAVVAEDSEITWKDSVFWRHTSPVLQAILTTKVFEYKTWITLLGILGMISLGLFFFVKTRSAGLAGLGILASGMALWCLNYYMPTLSPHWSQKYLFDSYYDTCTPAEVDSEVVEAYTPLLVDIGMEGIARDVFRYNNKRVCEEDVISWLITWRGETYYSYNELQPITKEAPQFLPYLEERNHGEKFYALMERGKKGGFKSKLEAHSKALKAKRVRGWSEIESWDVRIECDESKYFQMVSATPLREGEKAKGEGAKVEAQLPKDTKAALR